jgi:hypothetical protein
MGGHALRLGLLLAAVVGASQAAEAQPDYYRPWYAMPYRAYGGYARPWYASPWAYSLYRPRYTVPYYYGAPYGLPRYYRHLEVYPGPCLPGEAPGPVGPMDGYGGCYYW